MEQSNYAKLLVPISNAQEKLSLINLFQALRNFFSPSFPEKLISLYFGRPLKAILTIWPLGN